MTEIPRHYRPRVFACVASKCCLSHGFAGNTGRRALIAILPQRTRARARAEHPERDATDNYNNNNKTMLPTITIICKSIYLFQETPRRNNNNNNIISTCFHVAILCLRNWYVCLRFSVTCRILIPPRIALSNYPRDDRDAPASGIGHFDSDGSVSGAVTPLLSNRNCLAMVIVTPYRFTLCNIGSVIGESRSRSATSLSV